MLFQVLMMLWGGFTLSLACLQMERKGSLRSPWLHLEIGVIPFFLLILYVFQLIASRMGLIQIQAWIQDHPLGYVLMGALCLEWVYLCFVRNFPKYYPIPILNMIGLLGVSQLIAVQLLVWGFWKLTLVQWALWSIVIVVSTQLLRKIKPRLTHLKQRVDQFVIGLSASQILVLWIGYIALHKTTTDPREQLDYQSIGQTLLLLSIPLLLGRWMRVKSSYQ